MPRQKHGLKNIAGDKLESQHIAQSVVPQTEFVKSHRANLSLVDVVPVDVILVFVLVR